MDEPFGILITKNDENGLNSNLFCKAAPETLEEESNLFRISNINREEYKRTFYNLTNFTKEELKCIQKVHPHKKLLQLPLLQNEDSHSDAAGAHSQILSIRTEDKPRPSSYNQHFDPSTYSSNKRRKKYLENVFHHPHLPDNHSTKLKRNLLRFYKDAVALHHPLNINETL